MSALNPAMMLAFDREARTACEHHSGNNQLFGCYDQELVAKMYEPYKDFAVLPSGTLGVIKLKLEEEMRKRPAMRLATVFKLDDSEPAERGDFADFTLNILRACVGLLVLGFVLRKRDFKDDVNKERLLTFCAVYVLLPLLEIKLFSVVSNNPIVIAITVNLAVFSFLKKSHIKQQKIFSLKLLLGVLPYIMSAPYMSKYTMYQSLVFSAPYLDIIFALLQTFPRMRSPLYSSIVYYYYGILMTYRSFRIFKGAYLYCALGELDLLKLCLDIASLYLYTKFFVYLKTVREEDYRKIEFGVTRVLRLETRPIEESGMKFQDYDSSDVEQHLGAESDVFIQEEVDHPTVVQRKKFRKKFIKKENDHA